MSLNSVLTPLMALLAIAVSWPLRAADLNDGWKLKTGLCLNRSHKSLDRARAFVQRSPDFSLRNEGKEVRPRQVGEIFRREKIEGERLMLSVRSQGLEGWAPATSVVAVTVAEPFFSRAILQDPANSFAYQMRGTVRLVNDKCDLALADLNESLRLDPTSVAALHTRGLVWLYKDRPGDALSDLNKALELDPRNADVLGDRGMLYTSAKEYDNALADLDRAIELGLRSATVNLARGMIHVERHALNEAIAAFNRCLEINPECTDALVGIGIVHGKRAEQDDALAAFDKAIKIDPRCDAAYGQRAFLYRERGNDNQALADLDQAIRINPESSGYIDNRGFLLYSRADFDRALADVETAIRLDPNDDQPHQGRAWILMACPLPRIHTAEQAVVSATRACDLTKWNEPSYLATLAATYSETGDFAAAVKWQERAIDNLDFNDRRTGVYRALLGHYKSGKPYRSVGSWQAMSLRED